jgi:hypothetical protein
VLNQHSSELVGFLAGTAKKYRTVRNDILTSAMPCECDIEAFGCVEINCFEYPVFFNVAPIDDRAALTKTLPEHIRF